MAAVGEMTTTQCFDGGQEVLRCAADLEWAEAKLLSACFGADPSAVEHWRQVLDRAADAYDQALRDAGPVEPESRDSEPGSFS
jgi:hypothetical protein